MAKLPATIYRILENKQSYIGEKDLTMIETYNVFEEAGYKKSTANKWLLNWAVSGKLKFIPDREQPYGYRISLGDFSGVPVKDLLDNNRVWLPVKEVSILRNGDGIESCRTIL